jgi:hypothetical protein
VQRPYRWAENPFFGVARDRFLKTMRINSCDQVIREKVIKEKDPMNPGVLDSGGKTPIMKSGSGGFSGENCG